MSPKTKFSRFLGKRNITTDALAEGTNYSYASARAWRSGERAPGPSAKKRLMTFLRISRKQLERLF